MCIEERYVYTLSLINTYTVKRKCSHEISGKSNLNPKKSFAVGALQKLHRLIVP